MIKSLTTELYYLQEKLEKGEISTYNFEKRVDIIKGNLKRYLHSLKEAKVGEVREWGGKKYQKQSNGKWKYLSQQNPSQDTTLTKEEMNIIEDYTQSSFRTMNRALWSGEFIKDNPLQEDIILLSKAIQKSKKHKGIVWRKISINSIDEVKMYRDLVGGEVMFKGFTSTSKSKKEAQKFIPLPSLLFKIKSKSGADIEEYSAMREEQEVLFDYGTIFKVKSIKGEFTTSEMLTKDIVVELEEV